MKFRFLFTLLLVCACLASAGCEAVLSTAFKPTPRAKPAASGKTVSPNWYEGGEGYDKAHAEFVATKAPAAIYFYTDW